MTPEQYINRPYVDVTSVLWPLENGDGYGSFLEHLDGRIVFYRRGTITDPKAVFGDGIAEAFRLAFDGARVCRGCVGELAGGPITAGEWVCRHGTTSPRRYTDNAALLCLSCRFRLAKDARVRYLAELKRLNIHRGVLEDLLTNAEHETA